MLSPIDRIIHFISWVRDGLYHAQYAYTQFVVRRIPSAFTFMLVLTFGCISPASAGAVEMPEGTKGWSYFITLYETGYAQTPQEACSQSAANHWGVKLNYMLPSELPKPIYKCYYRNPVGGRIFDYTHSYLECELGYTAKSPGICVKWPEPSRPASCSPEDPGFAQANPVAIASGAKIQTETDLPGTPQGTLQIARTFRTLRDGGGGQSAGQGWSFSFDRNFQKMAGVLSPPDVPPTQVLGSFGDGSHFEFQRQSSGTYVSIQDKRETIKSLSSKFDDWALTTRTGEIERFSKVNGKFLLISSHSRSGIGQFYHYGPDNKLTTITDTSGRTLALTWRGSVVTSIAGPAGIVSYGYEMAKANDGIEIEGTEVLVSVESYDTENRLLATRRYHYEDPRNRNLLTGITDENGARFATYAYNASGQTIRSEHAGGVNRYTFDYPEKTKRIITDPLGTQRQFDLTYAQLDGGLVTSTNQPGGAGCGPGSSKLIYDGRGTLVSSTDFNNRKTCFITESTRGLVTSTVSGLESKDACPTSATSALAPSSRRVSRQWHPDFAIATAIASPNQITRYV